jgi:hypothetical protein
MKSIVKKRLDNGIGAHLGNGNWIVMVGENVKRGWTME